MGLSGDGTIFNPYQITSAEDLTIMPDYQDVGVHFKQMNDITLPSNFRPVGQPASGTAAIMNFNYNGNGKKIQGGSIVNPTNNNHCALFARHNMVTVENLILEDMLVSAHRINAAILFGERSTTSSRGNLHNLIFKNCTVTNTVSTSNTNTGLVVGIMTTPAGGMTNIQIHNSQVAALSGGVVSGVGNMTSLTGGAWSFLVIKDTIITGRNNNIGGLFSNIADPINACALINCTVHSELGMYVGGLCGTATSATSQITNCYVEGGSVISGGSIGGVGGLIGYHSNSSSYLTNCWSSAAVRGITNVGGLVGTRTSGTSAPWMVSCFALNPYIERLSGTSTTFGRLCGSDSQDRIEDCYALDTMELRY